MELLYPYFIKQSYLVLSMIVLASTEAHPVLDTQREVWFLVNERHSINCTIKQPVLNYVNLYWTRNGQRISNSLNGPKLTEIRVDRKVFQLIFQNATTDESANYTCHAKNASFSANSTTSVRIGEKPVPASFTCLFIADSSVVWYFPIINNNNKNNKFSIKYCMSSYSNDWCGSGKAIWKRAICADFNTTTKGCTQTQVTKFKMYIISVESQNKFGSTVSYHTMKNIRQQCINDHRPKIKVELMDMDGLSSFYISWHFPRGDEFSSSRITIFSTEGSEQAVTPITDNHRCDELNQCNKEIHGKHLLPCTNYTICVQNVLLYETKSPTISCIIKTTKNNNIPGLSDLRVTENRDKKSIEFQWKDSAFHEKGPFFYKYNLEYRDTRTKKRQDIVYSRTSVVIDNINGTHGLFTVQKCTLCGCGEKAIKLFELNNEPRPKFEERSTNSRKALFTTPVAIVVCFLVFLIIGILLFFMWKRKQNRRRRPEETPEEQLQEMEDIVVPVNHYDEVLEVPHYFDYDVVGIQEQHAVQDGTASLED